MQNIIVHPGNCKECKFGNQQPGAKVVPGFGIKSDIMFVGEWPNQTEALQGTAFSSEAGKTFYEILYYSGINPEGIYITNGMKCWCCDNKKNDKTGKYSIVNTPPTKKEILICNRYLKEEIAAVKPKIIIAMGATALSALEGGKSSDFKDRKGHASVYQGLENRIYVMPISSPGYIQHNGGMFSKQLNTLTLMGQETVNAIQEAIRLLKNEVIFQKHDYGIIDSRDSLNEMVSRIRERGVCTYDIETLNLKFFTKILGVGFGLNVGIARYVPFWVQPDGLGDDLIDFWEDKDISADEVRAILKDLLEDGSIQKGAHNAKFDSGRLRGNFGIEVKGLFWDSMCGAYLIDENVSHQLDDLKNVYIDLLGYKDKMNEETNNKKAMHKASLATISEYCCGDCDATYRLVKDQMVMFDQQPNLRKLMDKFYVPIMEFVADFEYNGVQYDVEKAKGMRIDYNDKAENTKKEIITLAGVPFNPSSDDQVRQVLFGVLGLIHEKQTKSGEASVDSDVLEDLALENPVARLIMDYNHLIKMQSTYMKRFIEEADENNRLHISFNPIGTVTGRPSSEGIQNIPREVAIKSLFIPKKNCILIQGDQSQAEVRCFAHYADEDVLKNAFEDKNTDIHCMVAAEVNKIPYDYFFKQYKGKDPAFNNMRQAAKGTVFGILFERGPASIAYEYGITLKEAEDFMEGFFGRFPKCKQFILHTHKLVEQTQQVSNIFGRIRHIPEINSKDAKVRARAMRQAVNSTIQSTASDITNLAMIRIHKKLKEDKVPASIVLTVYDSIIIETLEDVQTINYVKSILKENMEMKPHQDFSVRLLCDIDIYTAWGIKYKQKAA